MLVLIEGNEGTGKTTLIKNIAKQLSCITIKYSKDMRDLNKLYCFAIENDYLVLFDRGFITDLAYRIYDKTSGHTSLIDISRLLNENMKVIFCHSGDAYENAMTRGEDNIVFKKDHESIETIFGIIEQLLRSFTQVKIYDYDYAYDTVEDVINFIQGGEK